MRFGWNLIQIWWFWVFLVEFVESKMEPMDIVGKTKEDASLPKGLFDFLCVCIILWFVVCISDICECISSLYHSVVLDVWFDFVGFCMWWVFWFLDMVNWVFWFRHLGFQHEYEARKPVLGFHLGYLSLMFFSFSFAFLSYFKFMRHLNSMISTYHKSSLLGFVNL